MAIEAPETYDTQEGQGQFPVLTQALSGRGRANPYAVALQARSLEDREHIAAQTFDLHSQQVELNKVKTLADIEKEKLRIQDSMEAHRQVMQASKALSQLQPDDPEYQKKVLEISASNPAASKDPIIEKAIAFKDQQFLKQQEVTGQLRVQGTAKADEFAGRYGVPTMMKDNGYEPDYAGMEKVRADKFKAAEAALQQPGLETARKSVDEHGDVLSTAERPRVSRDQFKQVMGDMKALGLTPDDMENPETFKPVADKPEKLTKALADGTSLTVDADHYKQALQRYQGLFNGDEGAGAAPKAVRTFNTQTGNFDPVAP